jgi:hypothetical protein
MTDTAASIGICAECQAPWQQSTTQTARAHQRLQSRATSSYQRRSRSPPKPRVWPPPEGPRLARASRLRRVVPGQLGKEDTAKLTDGGQRVAVERFADRVLALVKDDPFVVVGDDRNVDEVRRDDPRPIGNCLRRRDPDFVLLHAQPFAALQDGRRTELLPDLDRL